ncbi:DUF7847 domain-containing protein [Halococcoides cellulosivorans]|uniref:DUF7847 domain-containing protein n=1 Tax=Halococcoides cellulosivorans TaxID=1679096 RepID=A0A2R4WZL6_9EURY|nr:hypothetical protein [Halococcoides cellulosivorans]AWB26998.1 hypothetical protein HARCEL1_04375 [Halococcoides cellulosivorans]
MRPIAAYQHGLKSLPRSPALAGVIAALGVLNAVLGYVPVGIMAVLDQPFLGNLTSMALLPVYLIVGPAVVGGLFGMAWQALDRRADLGDFIAGARSNYLQLLIWGVIIFAVEFAVVFVTMFVMWIILIILVIGMAGSGSAGGMGAGMAGLSIVMTVVFALVAIVTLGVVLLPYAIFQFIPGAIVFEDQGFVDAGKRGLGLLWQNPLPTLGFDLTVLGIGLVVAAISWVAMFVLVDFGTMFSTEMATAGSSQTMNPYASLGVIEIVALVGLSTVTSTIGGLLVIPAYAAFFRIVANV